jgi:hypothetical protein
MMKLSEKRPNVRTVSAVVLWLLCLPLTAASPVQEGRIIPADPVAAGRELVARLLSQRPAASGTNQAVLSVQGKGTNKFEVPVCIEIQAGKSSWSTTYRTQGTNKDHAAAFTVKHTENGPNEYRVMVFSRAPGATNEFEILKGQQAFIPFAGSDFWLADLGMEFLHWPTQRLLSKELRGSRSCDKLESALPPGQTNGYVRVVSWFDIDTGGPVFIEAYNAAGKKVKVFRPTVFRRVRGKLEPAVIIMEDPRTGSETELDLHPDT